MAIQNESIIGTYALLRNDLISRQDIFPWLACLYVAPDYRGQNIGAKLLQHALQETRKKGYDKLYLCTASSPLFFEKLHHHFSDVREFKIEQDYGEPDYLYFARA